MLIHIGYHKTASTWLQQIYFSQHPEIAFIGQHPLLWQHIIAPHDLNFNPTKVKNTFTPLITQAQQQNLTPILSSERLSGNPHSGGYDSVIIANRLKTTFPDAKIFIMVREQISTIASNYKQYIRVGGVSDLTTYLSPPIDGKIPLFRKDNFQYHLLVYYYQNLFGKEQVKVLPYEYFKQKPLDFIHELNEFIGIAQNISFPTQQHINTSQKEATVYINRFLNRFHGGNSFYPVIPNHPNILQKLYRLSEKLGDYQVCNNWFKLELEKTIQQQLQHYYQESNQQLEKLCDLQLSQYGYCV